MKHINLLRMTFSGNLITVERGLGKPKYFEQDLLIINGSHFASALHTDENRSATNSSDIIQSVWVV